MMHTIKIGVFPEMDVVSDLIMIYLRYHFIKK